jgi:hypothetical protein
LSLAPWGRRAAAAVELDEVVASTMIEIAPATDTTAPARFRDAKQVRLLETSAMLSPG